MPGRRPELLQPHDNPPPPRRQSNRLLGLLEAYQQDRNSMTIDEAWEVKMHLRALRGQFALERLAFSSASFIDNETVCMVFTGKPGGLCSLPARASLIVDQEWNVSGGIVFSGLRAEPLRVN